MIKKIDLGKLENEKIKKKALDYKVFQEKKDAFVKNNVNPEYQKYCNKVEKLLQRVDYQKFINGILSQNQWTDSVNFLDLVYSEKKLERVCIGIWDVDKSEFNTNEVSIEDFINIINNVTAKRINDIPNEEEKYKNLYLLLMKKINKETK